MASLELGIKTFKNCGRGKLLYSVYQINPAKVCFLHIVARICSIASIRTYSASDGYMKSTLSTGVISNIAWKAKLMLISNYVPHIASSHTKLLVFVHREVLITIQN